MSSVSPCFLGGSFSLSFLSHDSSGSLHQENYAERKAVQFEFILQSSTYATIALRELMKESSSATFHKTLTEQALGKQEPSSLESETKGVGSSIFLKSNPTYSNTQLRFHGNRTDRFLLRRNQTQA